MPTYEFRCPDGHDFEKLYRTISGAESTALCPHCGKPAERVMSAAGFAFKGSGFYLTDYGKNAHREKGPAESKAGAPAGESSSGESSSGKSTSGESGGTAKAEQGSSKGESAAPAAGATASAESKASAAKADVKPAAAPAKKSASE